MLFKELFPTTNADRSYFNAMNEPFYKQVPIYIIARVEFECCIHMLRTTFSPHRHIRTTSKFKFLNRGKVKAKTLSG